MTDKMTPEQRHKCMSHIRSKDTKPELKVRRWLWSHGYRYRLNVKSVPGKPDIVMRPYRTAIFVNGCFWHGHQLRFAQMYDVRGMKLEETRSGNNLRDLQDFARVELEQEYNERDIQSSSCCKIPSTNREFWVAKIRRNRERDQKNYRILQENGWQVIVIWECQLKSAVIDHTMREVELLLNNNLIERYKKRSPIPYTTEEESYPIAAEDRE
ncbi:MAG: very short patch repair endonuclease [Bacteroidales bacterium]|nr:very short patch repair endonuclease [Bacteroidales bacterium]